VTYLIDTDVAIDYLTGATTSAPALTELWRAGLAISIITYIEISEGIRGSRDPRGHVLVFRRFLKRVRVLGISRPVADRVADLRIHLRRDKRSVDHRALDIIIAATAIEHRLILVTRNTTDYADIRGLDLFSEATR
jgi:predicted nucleic acid-binding protein